jgi:tetratricopeptide (TPR) repeat protein
VRADAARAANRPDAALAAAEDALAADPASRDGFAAKAWALRRLGRAAEVDRAADAVLALRPDDPEVLGLLGSTRVLLGDLDGAARAWRRLIDAGRAPPPIYNDAAWLELFRGGATPLALDWARRAVDGSEPGERASLNTLAAIHAALGQGAEAREVFLRSIEGKEALDGEDWYVFGRIAEAWGLEDAARAAYVRVTPSKVDGAPDPSGPQELARRAIARLGPAAGAPVPPSGSAPRP